MRRFAFMLASVLGCQAPGTGDDACARAANLLNRCGVGLPVFSSGSCTATARALATCIVASAQTCDDLAALYKHPDECLDPLSDAGLDPVPPENVAVPGPEGDAMPSEPHDAAALEDATPIQEADAATDAATDALPDAEHPDAAHRDAGPSRGSPVPGAFRGRFESATSTPLIRP